MSQRRPKTILEWARSYQQSGWSIIPLVVSGDKTKPAAPWKPFQTRQASDDELIEWFGDGKASGLGVVFGAVSGNLASRDFDRLDSYEEWARRHPALANMLPTVATKRGRHVYALIEPESVAEFRRQIKKTGTGAMPLGDGELRAGSGCYSALPPTVRGDGFAYGWTSGCKLASMPLLPLDTTGWGCCYTESAESAGEPREPKTVFSPGMDSSPSVEPVPSLSPKTKKTRQRKPASAKPAPRASATANGGATAPAWSEWQGDATAAPRCGPGSPGWDRLTVPEQIEAAIAATVPTGAGMRHLAIFEFGRWLKAIPELAEQSAQALLPYVKLWHERARPLIRTKPFEESKLDFLECWDKIEHPKGQERIRMSFELALKADLPECAREYESDQIKLLVGFCRELQRAAGDQPFYLACRAAAPFLETTHTQVNRWLRLLCLDKVLREVEKGQRGRRRASTFRYLHPL